MSQSTNKYTSDRAILLTSSQVDDHATACTFSRIEKAENMSHQSLARHHSNQASPRGRREEPRVSQIPPSSLLLHHELDKLVVCWPGQQSFWKQRSMCSPTINAAITVGVGLPDHLIDLIISKLLADRGHDVAQLGGGDEAVVVTVEDLSNVSQRTCGSYLECTYLESLADLLFRVGVLHFSRHHGQKL
jgi:hypothetical protein